MWNGTWKTGRTKLGNVLPSLGLSSEVSSLCIPISNRLSPWNESDTPKHQTPFCGLLQCFQYIKLCLLVNNQTIIAWIFSFLINRLQPLIYFVYLCVCASVSVCVCVWERESLTVSAQFQFICHSHFLCLQWTNNLFNSWCPLWTHFNIREPFRLSWSTCCMNTSIKFWFWAGADQSSQTCPVPTVYTTSPSVVRVTRNPCLTVLPQPWMYARTTHPSSSNVKVM